MPFTATVTLDLAAGPSVTDGTPATISVFGQTFSGSFTSGVANITVPDSAIGSNTTGTINASVTFNGLTTTMSVPIYDADGPSSSGVPVFTTPVNGATLTGSTQTFTWSDPGAPAGRRYDLWINGVDQGPSITGLSWAVTGLPVNGSTINVELRYSDDSFATPFSTIDASFTAHTSTNVHPLVGFNIVDAYLAYSRPEIDHTPTQTFTSVGALTSHLATQYDHGGAIYYLTGNHTISSQIEPHVRNCIITTDPDNPARINGGGNRSGTSGSNFGFLLDDCENTEVSNFEITGMRFHGIAVGREDNEVGGTNNRVLNNRISNCGTTGMAIRNGADGTLIEGNTIFEIGTGDTRGEGIYLGLGNDANNGNLTNHVNNTTIRGNTIYGTNAEAVDVKRNCRGVIIEYNHFYDISVKSQGAVTVLIDISNSFQGNYNADVTIRHNVIHDTTTRDFNGDGIVIGLGSALIYGNIIFNNAAAGINVYEDFDGPNDDVRIEANICWDNAGGDIVNSGSTGNGTNLNPAVINRLLNYVSAGAQGSESQSADFVGPLPATGFEAFQPN